MSLPVCDATVRLMRRVERRLWSPDTHELCVAAQRAAVRQMLLVAYRAPGRENVGQVRPLPQTIRRMPYDVWRYNGAVDGGVQGGERTHLWVVVVVAAVVGG